MKLPREKDLIPEQLSVITAPAEGTLLVIGPPGSGKTVVGCYRADLQKEDADKGTVHFLVFNQVLSVGLDGGAGITDLPPDFPF